MNSLLVLIVSSIIIQYLVERVKDLIPNDICDKIFTYVKPSVISLVFSLLISFGCKINLFELLNFTIQPVWIGYLLTSIALSGGSVAINELIKSLASIKESNSDCIQLGNIYTEEIEDEDMETENEND